MRPGVTKERAMAEIGHHHDRAKPFGKSGRLGRVICQISGLFALFILLSAAILNVEVALRYLFNSPTIWAHETVIFITAVTFLFGGLFCISTNKHIRVVIFYDKLSGRVKRTFDIAISIGCAFTTALFAYAAWSVVERAFWNPGGDFRIESSGSAWNPPTPGLLKGFLFAALIAMSVQLLVLAYNYLRDK